MPNATVSHGTAARMEAAINGHNLEALVSCFAPDVHSEQPAHPSRSFEGSDKVRANWTMIFSMVPDLKAALVRSTIGEGIEWAEWSWNGSRADGETFALRGVTIHGLEDDQVQWLHFYMEPLEQAGEGVETAVKKTVGAK
jgi:ketosteroid isomerase-like protein